jgi:hypothetical protein
LSRILKPLFCCRSPEVKPKLSTEVDLFIEKIMVLNTDLSKCMAVYLIYLTNLLYSVPHAFHDSHPFGGINSSIYLSSFFIVYLLYLYNNGNKNLSIDCMCPPHYLSGGGHMHHFFILFLSTVFRKLDDLCPANHFCTLRTLI